MDSTIFVTATTATTATTDDARATSRAERIAYRTFSYAPNDTGRFQVYGPDGSAIEGMVYRSATVAVAAIDTRIRRAEALAAEHAEHAAREARRMEEAGTMTPAEAIRHLMGRRENRAEDLI